MITWNFWLPAVFVIFSFRFVPFELTEYVLFVLVFGIPVFISVRLKNVKVKTLGMAIQVRVPDTRRPDGVQVCGRFFTHGWHPYPTQTETSTERVFFPTCG
jgi:hypothetical protein